MTTIKQQEHHWVDQFTRALRNDDMNMIRHLHKQYPDEWTKPFETHYNNNLLHLIFENANKSMWGIMNHFCDILDNNERYMELMFQENNEGLTPIHFALIYCTFEDAFYFVRTVLNANASRNELFDHPVYANLLKPFTETVLKDSNSKKHKKYQYFVRKQLKNKLFESCTDDSFLMFTRLLLEHFHGCNIEQRDTQGSTPLLIAVEKQQENTVTYLLDMKANPNAEDRHGFTALTYCILLNNGLYWWKLLVDIYGADINMGQCLKKAVELNNLEAVKFLLNHNVVIPQDIFSYVFSKPAGVSEEEEQIGIKEIKFNDIEPEIIKILIQRYPKTNLQPILNKKEYNYHHQYEDPIHLSEEKKGRTVLYHCVKRGLVETVELLLHSDADPRIDYHDMLKVCHNSSIRTMLNQKYMQHVPSKKQSVAATKPRSAPPQAPTKNTLSLLISKNIRARQIEKTISPRSPIGKD
jgi:hypothetical protein